MTKEIEPPDTDTLIHQAADEILNFLAVFSPSEEEKKHIRERLETLLVKNAELTNSGKGAR